MIRLICIAIAFFYSMAVNADNYIEIAKEAEKNKNQIMQRYLKLAEEAKNQSSLNSQLIPGDLSDNKKGNVVIFLSFSMPEQSIIQLLRDAKRIHATLVIRGLIDNSFKETVIKMGAIVKNSGGGGVELNPLLFKKFKIEQVPALVVLSDTHCLNSKICNSRAYDIIYGNIPIYDSLKIIRDHGEVSNKIASDLLSRMGDIAHG